MWKNQVILFPKWSQSNWAQDHWQNGIICTSTECKLTYGAKLQAEWLLYLHFSDLLGEKECHSAQFKQCKQGIASFNEFSLKKFPMNFQSSQ